MANHEAEFKALLNAAPEISDILGPAVKQLQELATAKGLDVVSVVHWGVAMLFTQVHPLDDATEDILGITEGFFESQRVLLRRAVETEQAPKDGIFKPPH